MYNTRAITEYDYYPCYPMPVYNDGDITASLIALPLGLWFVFTKKKVTIE